MNGNKILPGGVIFFFCLFYTAIVFGQIATGGGFTLEQKAIAGGGGESIDASGAIFRLEGTFGQRAAGSTMTGGAFTQTGGFWAPTLAPTAAGAAVGGRVVAGNKTGVKDAFVTLTGGLLTAPITVRTNNFGYFRIENVEAGHFYVLRVRHRFLEFESDARVFTLDGDLDGIVFSARN